MQVRANQESYTMYERTAIDVSNVIFFLPIVLHHGPFHIAIYKICVCILIIHINIQTIALNQINHFISITNNIFYNLLLGDTVWPHAYSTAFSP